jgi:hypothetical protein
LQGSAVQCTTPSTSPYLVFPCHLAGSDASLRSLALSPVGIEMHSPARSATRLSDLTHCLAAKQHFLLIMNTPQTICTTRSCYCLSTPHTWTPAVFTCDPISPKSIATSPHALGALFIDRYFACCRPFGQSPLNLCRMDGSQCMRSTAMHAPCTISTPHLSRPRPPPQHLVGQWRHRHHPTRTVRQSVTLHTRLPFLSSTTTRHSPPRAAAA